MRVVARNIRRFYLSLFATVALGVFKSINLLWLGRSLNSSILEKIWSQTLTVRIKQKAYLFHTPNLLTLELEQFLPKNPTPYLGLMRFH